MSVDKRVVAATRLGMLVPTPAVLARTLLTCYAVTAALHLATISLATLLPLHVVALGGTRTQVGLIFSVMTVVSMVVRPTVGGWIDRYGARPVILPGAAVLVGTSLALHAVGTPIAVIALMAGLGLSSGLISTPASVLTAQASSPEHRGEALSTYYLASSVAIAAAPPAAFALLQGGGMPLVFSIVTVLAVVIAMLAVSLPPSVRKPASGPTRRLRLWSRHALPASGVLILTTMGQSAVYAFVPLAVIASGKNGLLMWFFGLYSSWLIVCRALLRAISDRFGRTRVLVPAMAAFALGLFLLALPPAHLSLLASAVLLASGASVLYPTLLALVVDRAPEPERGLAMGTVSAAWDFGIVVGAALLGFIIDFSSYGMGFLAAGVAASTGLATFLVMECRRGEGESARPC
jgi:MFS family permease